MGHIMDGIDFALLKFCLEHNDSPNLRETVLTARDPADYEWLRKVMQSLPSVAKQMQRCIEILHKESDLDNKINALAVLQDLVEDVDNANDLAKLGLGEIVKAMLFRLGEENDNAQAAQIRWMACWVISTLAQNNPFCQEIIAAQGILPITLNLLERSENAKVTQRALGVVSAMTRDCPAGQTYFALNKERLVPLLIKLMDHPEHQVSTKAMVVLRHLAEAKESIKAVAVEDGAVSVLNRCIQKEEAEESQREMAALALKQLAGCMDEDKDTLSDTIRFRLKHLRGTSKPLEQEEVVRLEELQSAMDAPPPLPFDPAPPQPSPPQTAPLMFLTQ